MIEYSMPGSQPRSQLKEKTVQALEERRLQRRFSGLIVFLCTLYLCF